MDINSTVCLVLFLARGVAMENEEKEIKKAIEAVLERMREVINDRSIPRNIRIIVEQATEKAGKKEQGGINYSTAIYMLDDISNDINMPSHARTDIWEIISMLEAIKERVK